MSKDQRERPIPARLFQRYSCTYDLSVRYEGEAEKITVRPPDLSPHGMFINTPTYLTQPGIFVPAEVRKFPGGGHIRMPMQRYKPEQIVMVLRQIKTAVANGKSTPQACKEAEILVQTYYRWRKEYGESKVE